MHINLRKVLALLSCLAMLCTVLPLGALSVSAADNLVVNGDFETGELGDWTVRQSAAVNTDVVYNGTYSLYAPTTTASYGYAVRQTVTVEADTDYVASVWYSYESTVDNMRLYLIDNSSSTTIATGYCKDSTATAGTWVQQTVTFNSGSYTSVQIKLGGGSAGYSAVYLDDVTLTKVEEAAEPSYDGYLYDGDFETATTDYWTVSGGEIVEYDGDYALKATTSSKYSTVAEQTITVEADTDYTLDLKSIYVGTAASAQARVHIYAGSSGTTELASPAYYWTITPSTWTSTTLTFSTGDNTQVRILIQQYASDGTTTDGNIYYDDFVVAVNEEGYDGSYQQEKTSGADIRMMTYNVLVGTDTDNGGYTWGSDITGRPEKACAMINYYKPDVIALEEFSGEWYDYFVENMTGYAFGGMNSNDSNNNGLLYTCLAYNTETVRLLDTDLYQMTVYRWSTQGMRYVNVGFFEVIATGEKFIAAALHPDAGTLSGTQDLNGDGVSEEGDGYWRQFQLEESAEYLAGLSETYQQPLIVGGDFNCGLTDVTTPDATSYNKFVEAGFTDATAGRYIDHLFYNSMVTHLYETTVDDADVSGASDHDAVFADFQFLDEYATPIATLMSGIKQQGRNYLENGTLWLDYSASGIEFSANCSGDVSVTFNTESIKNTDTTYGGVYFTVIVDGVELDRTDCWITSTGKTTITIAEDLAAGNHTFKIYRQTEHRGAEIGISAIAFDGTLNEAPAENNLYIEFIGDSISTGYGALGTSSASEQVDSPYYQDATAAYPYLVAEALSADFSDVAYSGLGCKYGYSGSLSMQTVYPLQRYQYDQSTAYGFDREPDVVVIALGTNDIANQTDSALREAGYQEMLDLVRAKNPNAKIVWIAGMMKTDDNEMIEILIEENGGAAEGLYYLGLTTNTAGAGWHPSAAGQQVFADELVVFLNDTVLPRYVADEETDQYNVMAYTGSSRMEMTADKLGLAFRFQIAATGIETVNNTEAVLDNATIDAFGDGVQYKLVRMGAILSNDPNYGLEDMKLADVNGKQVVDVNATYLCDLEEDSAQFAVRITNIPLANEATIIYARAYYVFEYDGREIVVYDDIEFANYINQYDSNDGVLEW